MFDELRRTILKKKKKKVFKQKETTSAPMCTDKGLSLETLALPTESTKTATVIYLSECQVHNQLALFSRQRYFLIIAPKKMRSCFRKEHIYYAVHNNCEIIDCIIITGSKDLNTKIPGSRKLRGNLRRRYGNVTAITCFCKRNYDVESCFRCCGQSGKQVCT